jgi:hypothetical protein
MITKKELQKNGYIVLPRGGWVRLDPMFCSRDWDELCEKFNCDPSSEEIILAVAGIKEINKEDNK